MSEQGPATPDQVFDGTADQIAALGAHLEIYMSVLEPSPSRQVAELAVSALLSAAEDGFRVAARFAAEEASRGEG